MSTTIFCTFEQQDLADLAIGDIRSGVAGIKSIHYINGHNSKGNFKSEKMAGDSWIGLFPLQSSMEVEMPSRPANVKIVCADSAAKAVKSRLINKRAYQIITMR